MKILTRLFALALILLAAPASADIPANMFATSTVAGFRASNFIGYPKVYLAGYYAENDGGQGVLTYVSSDTTTADNGCNIFVDSSGHRYYRVETSLKPDQCGAYGDNTHDDAAAFTAAFAHSQRVVCSSGKTYSIQTQITLATDNTTWDCAGARVALKEAPSTTQFMDVEKNNFTAKNILLVALSPGGAGNGFQVGATSSVTNIRFINVTADSTGIPSGLSQIFYLGAATHVWIDRCNFISSGYGVLQISGKATNDVKITNCSASDMYTDAVNQNGASVTSTQWLIDNFIFTGSHGFPTPAVEQRFVSFTSCVSCSVINSNAKNANGDSCIHIEGTSDKFTLANNTLQDCDVAGGNNGFVYLLTNVNLTSTNDTFIKTSALGAGIYAVDTSSGAYTGTLNFNGDNFIETDTSNNWGGFLLNFHSGQINITGGTASDVGDYVHAVTTNNLKISGVTVVGQGTAGANNFVYYVTGTTGGGGINVHIVGNDVSAITRAIFSSQNSNGTSPPTNWSVTNNYFRGNGTVLVQEAVNSWCSGNWYASTVTTHTCADTPGANTVDYKDYLQGTGVIH